METEDKKADLGRKKVQSFLDMSRKKRDNTLVNSTAILLVYIVGDPHLL